MRLSRPPNNYFDTALIDSVAEAYEELDGSGWCRAIVLASEGRHFCAGLDFSANAGQDIAALYAPALRLFAAPLPVVAAVQGAAIGGGCGLALSADFRVATAQSRFSANFARLGFHHGFALTVTLPAVVGPPGGGGPAAHRAAGRRRGGAGRSACATAWSDEDDLMTEAIAYAGRAGRARDRWRSAPSGPRCGAGWSTRPGWPWSTSTPSRSACAHGRLRRGRAGRGRAPRAPLHAGRERWRAGRRRPRTS